MSVNEEREEEEEASVHTQRAASPGFSYVSMKSNNSIGLPPDLSDGPALNSDSVIVSKKRKRAASPGFSCVSMKSNNSIGLPPDLSDGPAVTSDSVVDHRREFMISRLHKYACDLTLDPNTVNHYLVLSEKNRKVTDMGQNQSYPDHPERFDHYSQVLCGETLTGRCYWEAEWSGDGAEISVAYKGIKRKGNSRDCWFGWNEKSWSLFCSDHRFTVIHNNNETVVSSSPVSKRVGVFVDVSAGTLSFYSVSDTHTLTHLHTFTHTFTDQPLCAGFGLDYSNSSVSLCHIKQH